MRYFGIHTFITELLIAWLLPAYYSKTWLKLQFNWRKKGIIFLDLTNSYVGCCWTVVTRDWQSTIFAKRNFCNHSIAKVFYALIFHFETVQKLHSRSLNLLQINCVAFSTFFWLIAQFYAWYLILFYSNHNIGKSRLLQLIVFFFLLINCKNAKYAL